MVLGISLDHLAFLALLAIQAGTANKNFIGIVEGEQRTADQSTSNLRLNEIGVFFATVLV